MNVISPQSLAFPSYLRRVDAARYIQDTYGMPCQAPTRAKYACIGCGPAFRKAGKFPIYSRDDLDTWARSRLSEPVQSTSALSAYGYDHNPPERTEPSLHAPAQFGKLVRSTSETSDP